MEQEERMEAKMRRDWAWDWEDCLIAIAKRRGLERKEWSAGWCDLLALAVSEWLGEDKVEVMELKRVYRDGDGFVEHYTARLGDWHIDGDGMHTEEQILEDWGWLLREEGGDYLEYKAVIGLPLQALRDRIPNGESVSLGVAAKSVAKQIGRRMEKAKAYEMGEMAAQKEEIRDQGAGGIEIS